MWNVKKILVPVDGSECSLLASNIALDIAKDKGSEVIILFVVDVPHLFLAQKVAEMIRKDLAEPTVEKVLSKAKRMDIKAKTLILDGHPADTIVKVAANEKVDLIVMGTRGASFMKKILTGLGSVATAVLTHAHCPVLAVKEKEKGC
ncbi:MAG: universal stress protein [Thermodesulfovibrio sp.]|nr:universal stress protein [Thermodesulfovibrio sp.]